MMNQTWCSLRHAGAVVRRACGLVAAIAIVAVPAHAQPGTVSGIIRDRNTDQPIEGVTMRIEGTAYGASSRSNGMYVILGVPPGTYRVVAQRIGYATMTVTGVIVSSDVRRELNLELIQSPSPAMVAVPAPGTEPGWVRTPRPPDGADVVPSFEDRLFPPELVMQHQRVLELTAEQRRAITDAVKGLQGQTLELQWSMQAEQTALMELLEKRPIREQAAIAQINKLLELEAAVKRTHLATLVRIKNTLTDKQVQQLNELRKPGWFWKGPGEYEQEKLRYRELLGEYRKFEDDFEYWKLKDEFDGWKLKDEFDGWKLKDEFDGWKPKPGFDYQKLKTPIRW